MIKKDIVNHKNHNNQCSVFLKTSNSYYLILTTNLSYHFFNRNDQNALSTKGFQLADDVPKCFFFDN